MYTALRRPDGFWTSPPISIRSVCRNPSGRAAQAGTDNAERYPDPHCRRLKAAIAQAEGVPEEWVIPGAGASDLLYRYAYALRPREALLTAPAFSEYETALAASGCRALRFHSLKPEEGFRLNERILASFPSAGAVFLASPNNPTGGRDSAPPASPHPGSLPGGGSPSPVG